MNANPRNSTRNDLRPQGITQSDMASSTEVARWADAMWAGQEGIVVMVLGKRTELTANGKYQVTKSSNRYFNWPEERQEFIRKATKLRDHFDIWTAPTLRNEQAAPNAFNALSGMWLYTELDDKAHPWAVQWVADRGGLAIASGTEGHHHVYLPVAAHIPPAEITHFSKRLSKHLGSDAMRGVSQILRVPGTFNRKYDPPTPAMWAVEQNGSKPLTLEELDEQLPPLAEEAVTAISTTAREPLLSLPGHLSRKLLEKPSGDRSVASAGILRLGVESGLSDGMLMTLLERYPPAQAKRSEKGEGWYQGEVARLAELCGEHRLDHDHVGKPCDKAGCPNKPDWMTGEPDDEPEIDEDDRLKMMADVDLYRQTDHYLKKKFDRWSFHVADADAKVALAPGNKDIPEPTDWDTVEVEERSFEGTGLLVQPGWLTLVVGDYESAKTMAFLWVAAQKLRAGETVIFIDEESPIDQTRSKLAAFNLTRDELSRFIRYDHPGWNLAVTPEILDQLMERHPQATLVGIDSYSRIVTHAGLEDDNAGAMRMFTTLERFAVSHNVGLYLIDHQGMNGGSHARNASVKVQQASIAMRLRPKTKFTKDQDGVLEAEVLKHRGGNNTGQTYTVLVTTTEQGKPLQMDWHLKPEGSGSSKASGKSPLSDAAQYVGNVLNALRARPEDDPWVSVNDLVQITGNPEGSVKKALTQGLKAWVESQPDPHSKNGRKLWRYVSSRDQP